MRHRAFPTSDGASVVADRVRPIAAGAAAVLVLLVVAWWVLRPATPPVEASLPMAGSGGAQPADATSAGPTSTTVGASTTTTTAAPRLVVQAAGEVARPGVYRLDPDARVVDLVEAAGGLGSQADRQRINLAAPVADGERVWVPAVGQEEVPEVVAGAGAPVADPAPTGGAGPTGASVTPAAPVDLNTATAADLDALPGVGPATATAILAHRDAVGRFGSVDELLDVRGIGEAKLEQLRPLVRV